MATEIDYDSTIVAGNRELIAAILHTDGLDAAEVRSDTDLSSTGDTVNSPTSSR